MYIQVIGCTILMVRFFFILETSERYLGTYGCVAKWIKIIMLKRILVYETEGTLEGYLGIRDMDFDDICRNVKMHMFFFFLHNQRNYIF